MGATERRGRRRKQLLDGIKETREIRKFIEKALDRTLWRTRFARGCGSCKQTRLVRFVSTHHLYNFCLHTNCIICNDYYIYCIKILFELEEHNLCVEMKFTINMGDVRCRHAGCNDLNYNYIQS